jgi:Small nuclear ribonucleoprotein (snRNP) homolog
MIMPMKVLEESLNTRVAILMKDNRVLEGALTGYDEYMNMVMEDAEEHGNEMNRKLGKVIIRGSNVVRMVPL